MKIITCGLRVCMKDLHQHECVIPILTLPIHWHLQIHRKRVPTPVTNFFTCSIVANQDRPHHSHVMPVRGLWNWCFIRGIVVSVLTIIVTCDAVWPGRVYLGLNVNQLVSSRLSVKLVSEVRVLGVPSQRPDGEIGASIRLYNESVKEPLPDVVNCLTQLYSSWFE